MEAKSGSLRDTDADSPGTVDTVEEVVDNAVEGADNAVEEAADIVEQEADNELEELVELPVVADNGRSY